MGIVAVVVVTTGQPTGFEIKILNMVVGCQKLEKFQQNLACESMQSKLHQMKSEFLGKLPLVPPEQNGFFFNNNNINNKRNMNTVTYCCIFYFKKCITVKRFNKLQISAPW